MCSIESIRSSPISTSNKSSNRKILIMIEKRLKHLREELKTLAQHKLSYATRNLLHEQSGDQGEYYVQYKKRLTQLLRSYEKQV